METVANTRAEKNIQNLKEERSGEKVKERNDQRIAHLYSKIREEKESIKECLDENFFSMAMVKIQRIEEMNEKIITLRTNN